MSRSVPLALALLVTMLAALPAGAVDHQVSVQNFVFVPDTLTIQVGDTVTWTNDGGLHNVNAPGFFRCANGCDGEGGDGNPSLEPWSFTRTFDEAAVIDYACEVHVGVGMIGQLTVVGEGGPTLTVAGSCPGQVTLDIAGGTPNNRAALLFGSGPGSDPLPGGPCVGLATELANPRLLAPVNLDANGAASLSVTAPMLACGVSIQALDVATCGLTNGNMIPGNPRMPNKRRELLLKKRRRR